MSLPKHIRLAGCREIEKLAAATNIGLPGITGNVVQNLPESQTQKKMVSPPQVQNPQVQQANTLTTQQVQNIPSIAPSRFAPAMAKVGEGLGMLAGDLGMELADQMWMRHQAKKNLSQYNTTERPMTSSFPMRKLGAVSTDNESVSTTPDNADRPFAPYIPQTQETSPYRESPNKNEIVPRSGPVSDNFHAVDMFNSTWNANEPTLAGGGAAGGASQGSAYNDNSQIKSSALRRIIKRAAASANDERGAGDAFSVNQSTRDQPATFDITEIRGGIGDSPYEGIPRMHDMLAGGRMDASNIINKQFDANGTMFDTSIEEGQGASGGDGGASASVPNV